MKILWVKAGRLLPVDTGGKIRSYNILRQLDRAHEVTYLSYYDGPRDEPYEQQLRGEFRGAQILQTGFPVGGARQGLHYASRMAWAAPYAVSKFTSSNVQQLLASWYGERRFDVAVCDFLSASLNFPSALAIPTLLFQHNVETVLWKRQARYEPNLVKRLTFKLEAAKMDRYERTTVRRFHHVIAVSEQDRALMTEMTAPERITVVPTGVDLERYRFSGTISGDPLVVFTGSMDWEANIDGIEFFCRDVWPQVLAKVPKAKFRVVGRNPHPRVKKLASDSVEITGTVPSVIEHLEQAAVFVVPLRIGGGTRLKIYEAMAMGKAVVSTSVGAEGLDVHHGRDIMLADDAPSFANDIVELLTNRELRARFGAAAAELAAQYSWPAIGRRFADILQKTWDQAAHFRVAAEVTSVRS